MFGIIRPCRHRLDDDLHSSWQAHLCGLCLALRTEHGQFARVVTNYDALVLSALVEAQEPARAGRRTAGPCPLRGMHTASVVRGDAARLAASVSLVLAAARTRDHVDDHDGMFARRAVARSARAVANRWVQQGASTGHGLGFDTGVLVAAISEQAALESSIGPGSPLAAVTAPTETATAAALSHTAVLTRRLGNVEPLAEIGRHFARIAHLVDAVEDLAEDQAAGAWNPLVATGAGIGAARLLCDDSVASIESAYRRAEFDDPRLVERLLLHELPFAVDRTFGPLASVNFGGRQPQWEPWEGMNQQGRPQQRRRGCCSGRQRGRRRRTDCSDCCDCCDCCS